MANTKISKHYAGNAGEEYSRRIQSDSNLHGYAINARYFVPYLKPTDRILDFGCGNGGMLSLLKKEVACAEGLEVNPASAALARAHGLTVYGGVDELPQGPTYNVIVTNHVLEHIRDVCGTLEALRSRIVPGGLLVAKLPIDHISDAHQRGWSEDDIDHHLQTWTPRLFANVLFESGFVVKECRILTAAWHPKLFPLEKLGLGSLAYWLLAQFKHRHQVFAVAKLKP